MRGFGGKEEINKEVSKFKFKNCPKNDSFL